ncbi:hypothetical protein KDX30_20150 [Pseudomonas sp. CDFA 553]|uniref:hypothetical protein n=1 Tax=Pseudomonas quasicaspiana TaxID=2829821 RepID=UPI001E4387EF|nr:hypothetical protein [Pseudomonas quasicaspiana]MCD5990204.1 hypothetical protein [Pseudomonas quasicaspiana]
MIPFQDLLLILGKRVTIDAVEVDVLQTLKPKFLARSPQRKKLLNDAFLENPNGGHCALFYRTRQRLKPILNVLPNPGLGFLIPNSLGAEDRIVWFQFQYTVQLFDEDFNAASRVREALDARFREDMLVYCQTVRVTRLGRLKLHNSSALVVFL